MAKYVNVSIRHQSQFQYHFTTTVRDLCRVVKVTNSCRFRNKKNLNQHIVQIITRSSCTSWWLVDKTFKLFKLELEVCKSVPLRIAVNEWKWLERKKSLYADLRPLTERLCNNSSSQAFAKLAVSRIIVNCYMRCGGLISTVLLL